MKWVKFGRKIQLTQPKWSFFHFKNCEGLSRVAFMDGNGVVMLGKVVTCTPKEDKAAAGGKKKWTCLFYLCPQFYNWDVLSIEGSSKDLVCLREPHPSERMQLDRTFWIMTHFRGVFSFACLFKCLKGIVFHERVGFDKIVLLIPWIWGQKRFVFCFVCSKKMKMLKYS